MNEAKHDELNSKLWENNELKPEVKDKLLDIVDKYSDNLDDIDVNLNVSDVVLVGSNANYNYSQNSDIDLHIVADLSNYSDDSQDLAYKLYDAYKRLFNKDYDPTIYGCPVELYVERDEIHANSNGMYSLYDGWLKEPKKTDIPTIDVDELPEYKELKSKIESFDETTDEAEIEEVVDNLYILRQQSILKDGEYGEGNLIFKELRNSGCLDKLKDLKRSKTNTDLSLKESVILEGIQADFKKWCQNKELADKFLEMRVKLPKPYNDMMFWMSKKNDKTQADLKRYLDNYKSKIQKEKEAEEDGLQKIYEDENWKVSRVLTYDAARLLGDNTTWCITGRWAGAESEGQYYFDKYLKDDYAGYYFFFNKHYTDPRKDQKYMVCPLQSNPTEECHIYDQEHNPTPQPYIPNCSLKIKGLPSVAQFEIEGDILISANLASADNVDYYDDNLIVIPENVTKISDRAFYNKSVDNIKLNNVQEIGNLAFSKSLLSRVDLSNVSKLGKAAFFFCGNLLHVKLGANITELPAKLFAYCDDLSSIEIYGHITAIDESWLEGLTAADYKFQKLFIYFDIANNDLLEKWCLKYGAYYKDLSERSNTLSENIPSDLIAAYRKSSFTGLHGRDTDYYNSAYKHVTKVEAYNLYKSNSEDFLNLRFIFENHVVSYRRSGTRFVPVQDFYTPHSYNSTSGNKTNDIYNIDIKEVIRYSSNIYSANEVEKSGSLLKDRQNNPASDDYIYNMNNSNFYKFTTDFNGRTVNRYPHNKHDFNFAKIDYTKSRNTYKKHLKKLELMKNFPNVYTEDDIREQEDEVKIAKRQLDRYSSIFKDFNAQLRYANSQFKLKDKYDRFKLLRSNIDHYANEINDLRDAVADINKFSDYKERSLKSDIESIKRDIRSAKRDLSDAELALEYAKDEDDKELNSYFLKLERDESDLADAVARINKLLRKS